MHLFMGTQCALVSNTGLKHTFIYLQENPTGAL